MTKTGAKKAVFEKSLERLEAIVGEMEGGKLSLEDMMKRFEEGMDLVKACTCKLNEVERKIEILIQKDGRTSAEPFDPGEEFLNNTGKS